jgi:hypothetical protein
VDPGCLDECVLDRLFLGGGHVIRGCRVHSVHPLGFLVQSLLAIKQN